MLVSVALSPPKAAAAQARSGALVACRRVPVVTVKSDRQPRHRQRTLAPPTRRRAGADAAHLGHRTPSGQRARTSASCAAASVNPPADASMTATPER